MYSHASALSITLCSTSWCQAAVMCGLITASPEESSGSCLHFGRQQLQLPKHRLSAQTQTNLHRSAWSVMTACTGECRCMTFLQRMVPSPALSLCSQRSTGRCPLPGKASQRIQCLLLMAPPTRYTHTHTHTHRSSHSHGCTHRRSHSHSHR